MTLQFAWGHLLRKQIVNEMQLKNPKSKLFVVKQTIFWLQRSFFCWKTGALNPNSVLCTDQAPSPAFSALNPGVALNPGSLNPGTTVFVLYSLFSRLYFCNNQRGRSTFSSLKPLEKFSNISQTGHEYVCEKVWNTCTIFLKANILFPPTV